MAQIMFWEAVRRAHDEEMANDPMVICMGEDIGVAGGTYKATNGLYAKYGAERVMDTPISENGFTGLAVGASFLGVRPIVEIMSVNFAWLALDQLFNSAAKVRYMSGGQLTAPVVVRSPGGTAHMLGAQHSARMEKVFMGIAGLRVVTPSNPRQAYGLLKSAVRCNDPVFINEHELMYNMKGEVPDGEYFMPLEGSEVAREGRDVTLFGYNISVHWCLAAADILSKQYRHRSGSHRPVFAGAAGPRRHPQVGDQDPPRRDRRRGRSAGRRRFRSDGDHQRRMLLRTRRRAGARIGGKCADPVQPYAGEGGHSECG